MLELDAAPLELDDVRMLGCAERVDPALDDTVD